MPESNGSARNVGKIIEIKGVVIDAVFPETLPEINTALRVQAPEQDGRPAIDLVAEVEQHLGDDRVRAVAMDSTDGLARMGFVAPGFDTLARLLKRLRASVSDPRNALQETHA